MFSIYLNFFIILYIIQNIVFFINHSFLYIQNMKYVFGMNLYKVFKVFLIENLLNIIFNKYEFYFLKKIYKYNTYY